MLKSRSNPDFLSGARLGFAILAVGALAIQAAHSETLSLKLRNGDRVTGSVLSENSLRLILSNAWTTNLTIPITQIETREKIGAPPVIARPVQAAVTPASAKPVSAASPAIAPKKPSAWHGEAQVGTDLTFSAKDRQLYYARLKLIYAHDLKLGSGVLHQFKNILDYNFAYGFTEGIVSDNRMEGSSKTDFDMSKKIFVYNLGGAGYDEIAKTDLRYEIGPGLGYHLLKTTNLVLNTESGVNYQARFFSDHRKDERFFLRLAQDLNWKISHRLSFDEKFEFFPRIEDFGQYRSRFESNLRFLLRENLSLNFTVVDIYDTQPARDVSKNDLQIRSSLGLKF